MEKEKLDQLMALIKKKPDCINCIHYGGIASGSGHHIKCNAFGSKGFIIALTGPPNIEIPIDEEKVTIPSIGINPHGVANGWCHYPINFDQCWINYCSLMQKKENAKDTTQATEDNKT